MRVEETSNPEAILLPDELIDEVVYAIDNANDELRRLNLEV